MKNIILLTSICLSLTVFAQSESTHYCRHHKENSFKLSEASYKNKMADNTRSDTLDVLNYYIQIDLSDIPSGTLSGTCKIDFEAKMDNVEEVNLDLQAYNVTSVKINGNESVNYQYDSLLLKITLDETLNEGESLEVEVDYNGIPQSSAWGGFYMGNNYAFNMGVGIGVDPPNYGRAWFPCFDNFVERSTYDFEIKTAFDNKAFCGGLLVEEMENLEDSTKTWKWKLNQEIPTYLASVAVADYEMLEAEYTGMERNHLVQLAATKFDTTKLKNSFIHLPDALTAFEKSFGPYQWDRIGFSIVNFGGGAMEHACNVAYPKFAVTGNLSWESLMAHEFAHHWWGDLVTCRTADDMWINEGWASYCERLFFEEVYDKNRYQAEVKANHKSVIYQSHLTDRGYHPLSGIPFDYTYSATTYNKGSDVLHSMRSYMGDSLFFKCTTDFLTANAFTDVDAEQFRDFLTDCSGINMGDYFDGWIFNPGFTHLSIDSVIVDDDFNALVYVRQRLNNAPAYFRNIPVEITFMDENREVVTHKMIVEEDGTVMSVRLPFDPVLVFVDFEEKISDAAIEQRRWVKSANTNNFSDVNVIVKVNEIVDSFWVNIEHHLVTPDRIKTQQKNLILSESHYWKIDVLKGSEDAFIDTEVRFTLNGKPYAPDGKYLDFDLFVSGAREDSVYLMHRENPSQGWSIFEDAEINTFGSSLDKSGVVIANSLVAGEYAFAINDPTRTDTLQNPIVSYNLFEIPLDSSLLPIDTMDNPIDTIGLYIDEFSNDYCSVHPNPTSGKLYIDINNSGEPVDLILYDISGKEIINENNFTKKEMDLTELESGVYILVLKEKSGKSYSQKIIKK